MQPNILFILIDGLRADQCFSKNKTSYTPFIDSLVSTGIYFENTFSSSDGTTISLNCTFNSKFQFETGVRARKIILLEDNHLQNLKNSGYKIVGIIQRTNMAFHHISLSVKWDDLKNAFERYSEIRREEIETIIE